MAGPRASCEGDEGSGGPYFRGAVEIGPSVRTEALRTHEHPDPRSSTDPALPLGYVLRIGPQFSLVLAFCSMVTAMSMAGQSLGARCCGLFVPHPCLTVVLVTSCGTLACGVS